MLQTISAFFWRISTWKVLVFALFAYALWGGLVMTKGMHHIQDLCGQKVEILDLQFHSSPENTRAILSSYTAEAKQFGMIFGLVFDTIYPLVYGFLFIVTGCLVFRKRKEQFPWLFYLPLLPLLIIVMDYAENINIASLLYTFPSVSDIRIEVTSAFSSLKWILVFVEALLLIGGLIWLVLPSKQK
ncbi:MAG: hypothetical protein U0T32_03370 [Chitinophagales bacterium]